MNTDDENNKEIRLDDNLSKNLSKDVPPPSEISTSRNHSMDYVTVDGVILRTGYADKRDWYLLPIREGLDNAIDFLWKYYRGAENTSITIEVTKDDKLFRLRMRNSNYKDVRVFQDLDAIFDFDMRHGSKQDVHIISRGMLGDAMKQILALGYVLLHIKDEGTAFTDKQWEHPLIIRHNKKEWKVCLHVDKARQQIAARLKQSPEELSHTDTEIELVLPIIDEVRSDLDRFYIEQFCRKYTIFTTDIWFKFRILDNSTESTGIEHKLLDKRMLASELIGTLSTSPRKTIVNIDIPALHPIATEKEWSNSDGIHSYLPGEFTSRITNVHHKDLTSVYGVLLTFREGSNIKKTLKNEISIAELLLDPHKDKKIEESYYELKDALPPSEKLSLPYTGNRKERMEAFVPRVAGLYDIDKSKKSSYWLQRGHYNDGKIQYPFAFELLAIPLVRPHEKETEFIGAVNYSVSPKGTKFEGDYDAGGGYIAENIDDVLKSCGFHKHSKKKSRLSCIVIGNLITPRRDPHGHDKSRLDMQPFSKTIVTAVKKVASDIQTFSAVGYVWSSKTDDYRDARRKSMNRKVSAKELLRQFLIKERGLPS